MENSEDKKQRLHSQNYTESRNTSYSIVRRYGSITFDEALTQLRDVLKDKGFSYNQKQFNQAMEIQKNNRDSFFVPPLRKL